MTNDELGTLNSQIYHDVLDDKDVVSSITEIAQEYTTDERETMILLQMIIPVLERNERVSQKLFYRMGLKDLFLELNDKRNKLIINAAKV